MFIGDSTSAHHADVSQGRFMLDKSMCCHAETEVADQTCCLVQSQRVDIRSSSSSTNPECRASGMVACAAPGFISLVWFDRGSGFNPTVCSCHIGSLTTSQLRHERQKEDTATRNWRSEEQDSAEERKSDCR